MGVSSTPGTGVSYLIVRVKLTAVHIVIVAPEHGDQLSCVEGIDCNRAATWHKHKLWAASTWYCKLQPFTTVIADLPIVYLRYKQKGQVVCVQMSKDFLHITAYLWLHISLISTRNSNYIIMIHVWSLLIRECHPSTVWVTGSIGWAAAWRWRNANHGNSSQKQQSRKLKHEGCEWAHGKGIASPGIRMMLYFCDVGLHMKIYFFVWTKGYKSKVSLLVQDWGVWWSIPVLFSFLLACPELQQSCIRFCRAWRALMVLN